MGNSIKPMIETAEKTGTCNIAGQGLTEFPEPVLRLARNLRTLDVSKNKIPQIPPPIGKLSMLKNFNFAENRLSSIPNELGNLKKMEVLSGANNRISHIPDTLCNLTALREVNFSHNRIVVFPIQFCGLKHLDSLNLSGNSITVLPDAVKTLEVLELNLNQNRLSTLSEALAECPRLKVLRVQENCLQLTALTPKILKTSKISLLALDGNVFSEKDFHQMEGYDQYMERYTATKKKFN